MFIRRLSQNLRFLSQNCVFTSQGIDTVKFPQLSQFSSKINVNRNLPNLAPDPETALPKKKKPLIPRITLLSGTDVSVSTLEEAQKLAKRRDLKLVKIIDLDTKTQRPVYRLMTGAEYHEEDLKQRQKKKEDKQKSTYKGEKVLIISQNISEHDLQTYINKILKWLAKKYEVRMVINGNSENNKKAEDVYSFLEKNLSEQSRLVQKRQKGSDIKFQVLPPKEHKRTEGNEDNKGGSKNENPI